MLSEGAVWLQKISQKSRIVAFSTVGIAKEAVPEDMVGVSVHYFDCDSELPSDHECDDFGCPRRHEQIALSQPEAFQLFS